MQVVSGSFGPVAGRAEGVIHTLAKHIEPPNMDSANYTPLKWLKNVGLNSINLARNYPAVVHIAKQGIVNLPGYTAFIHPLFKAGV